MFNRANGLKIVTRAASKHDEGGRKRKREPGKQKRDNRMAARGSRYTGPGYLIVKAKIQPPNARTFYYATYCELRAIAK